MRPFVLERPATEAAALQLASAREGAPRYLAGGTNLLDLMKIGVEQPGMLVDLSKLRPEHREIAAGPDGLSLGAFASMAEVARDEAVRREYPVLASALQQAASAQLRNMATLGGNVLQRTRCNYFRDPSWAACNKRVPGSGCAAIGGVNRRLAVLGVSEHCIANYPGDFAIGLVALGATVELAGAAGVPRTIAFEELHVRPGDTPHVETSLAPGEMITRFVVPPGPWTRRSLYVKVRDRASYDFALASAAVALHLGADGVVQAARIGVGGLVAKPWRSHEAEAALVGRQLDERSAEAAAEAGFAGAVTHGENGFKPELGRRTLARALLEAGQMQVTHGR